MKKTLFLLAFLSIFVACKNDKPDKKDTPAPEEKTEKISFTNINISAEDFEVCQNKDCPKLRISYLKPKKNTEIFARLNKENEARIAQLFNTAEEDSTTNNLRQAAKGFIEEYLHFKEEYAEPSAEYEAELSQKTLAQTDSLVVIETTSYLYTGGAHGYGATRYSNFSTTTGKLLSHNELIADTKAFTAYAEAKFREKFKIPSEKDINAEGFFFENDTFALPENIAITNDEVLLVYNPYEAASYAQGALKFAFPKKEVAQWLKF